MFVTIVLKITQSKNKQKLIDKKLSKKFEWKIYFCATNFDEQKSRQKIEGYENIWEINQISNLTLCTFKNIFFISSITILF